MYGVVNRGRRKGSGSDGNTRQRRETEQRGAEEKSDPASSPDRAEECHWVELLLTDSTFTLARSGKANLCSVSTHNGADTEEVRCSSP
ncbi:hypothetical protein GCM10027088_37670 [Nocardia goodfellowii]